MISGVFHRLLQLDFDFTVIFEARIWRSLCIYSRRFKKLEMDKTSIYLFLWTVVAYLIAKHNCIRCYICSYSPDDRNNRTDKCTEDNFQPQHVYVHDCPLGCEAFVQYDANEDLEHWRRNCAREGQSITGDCRTTQILGWKQIRCTCDQDLCNRASTSWNTSFISIVLLNVVLYWTLAT